MVVAHVRRTVFQPVSGGGKGICGRDHSAGGDGAAAARDVPSAAHKAGRQSERAQAWKHAAVILTELWANSEAD